MIPDRKFLNWSGFADDGDWQLAVEPAVMRQKEVVIPAWIKIQSEHWTILTKGIDGQSPNWRVGMEILTPDLEVIRPETVRWSDGSSR